MTKKDYFALDKKIQEKLNPFYVKRGYALSENIFEYKNECSIISWGARAHFIDWVTYQPSFKIVNKDINNLFKTIFPNRLAYYSSLRTQNTLEFAHEFEIHEFDDRQYNFCNNNTCTYIYQIGSDTDLDPILKDHIEFMEKVTFVYFKKLSTVKGISDYFNNKLLNLSYNDLKDEKIMRSFQKEEVLSSIIASYLEKEERLNEVLKTYKKLYSISEFYLNDINVLENWINEQKDGIQHGV